MRRLLPVVLLAGWGAAQAYQAPIPLPPAGTVRVVELRSGESHQYSLPLRPGELVNIVAQQLGVALEAALFAPDGKVVAHSNLPNGDQGPAPIVAIAESAGEYKLVIRSLTPNGPSGRYELHVEAVREATFEDRRHVDAERLVDEAHELRKKPTSVSIAASLEKYGEALSYFQSVGDRYREALTLKEIGLVRVLAGDYRNALESYRHALNLFTALGDRPGQASTENNMAGAFDLVGDIQAAMVHFQRALDGYRKGGQRASEANVLNNIGKLYSDMADWQKAIDYYRQALPLLEVAGDKSRQAFTLHNLGSATRFTDLGAAVDYHHQALELRRAIRDRPGEAQSLAELASVHIILGKLDAAIDYGEQSLTIYRSIGNRAGEARTLRTLGAAYARRGDMERGLGLLREAVASDRERGDKREESGALMAIGLAQKQPALAREALQQAATLAGQIGDSATLATSERGLARAERDLGNLPEARQHAERAIELVEKVRGNAGGQDARASYISSALEAYSIAIDILMLQHNPAAALETIERSRARSLVEMLSESGADIREGVDPKLLTREREIANLLNAQGTRLLPLMGRDTPQSEALKQQVRALETEYQDVEAEIRKNNPRYAALTQPSPLRLKQIQEDVLDDSSLVLEYSLGEKRSYLFAVSNTGIDAWELAPRERIEAAARNLLQLVTSRASASEVSALPAAARELSDLVIAPARSALAGKRLVIVADGALQLIPFAMLPTPGSREPLVAAHEIVFLPSVSALAGLRQEIAGRTPPARTLAVFADPVYDAADVPPSPDATRILEHLTDNALKIPRLPFTAVEADQILRVAGGTGNWKATGYGASRAAALSGQLSQYRYLHFATHGILDTERPSLSALVLSQVDENHNPQDGFLRVNDIYNTRLSADLVVLSACQTGLGKEVRGEGLMGLTRAFLYAGAPRVIVSLWSVNDRATAELMTTLYRGMLKQGKTPAAALRAAQLELRKQKRWESPYYWAAFVQHGEWK